VARTRSSAQNAVSGADEGCARSGGFWSSGPCFESRVSQRLWSQCAPPIVDTGPLVAFLDRAMHQDVVYAFRPNGLCIG
jgi:hypothetical protein